MKRYVVYKKTYGYWRTYSDGTRITTTLEECDKFRFWISAFINHIDVLIDGSKIVKVEV